MVKKALVLAGGGAKGAYQMGAWRAFRQLDLHWDLIVGTSIGALNGALMVQDSYEKANELWESIEYRKVFGDTHTGVEDITTAFDIVKYTFSDLLMEGSFDTGMLEALIVEYLDEKALRDSKVDFGLMTVEIPAMRPHAMMKKDIPDGKMAAYLMASASCFPIFRPKEIDGVKFIDGGYYDNVPINMAIAGGGEDIVVVDLEAIGFVRDPKEEIDTNIKRIRPYWNLGAVFAFDKNLYARNRALGYNDTMKAYGQLEGMYYTFKLGECQKNYRQLKQWVPEAQQVLSRMLNRPVARTLQTIDRRSAIGFLSRGSWEKDGSLMLCRVAELAGMVFNLSPEITYSFERFNNRLLKEYLKQGGLLYITETTTGDITHILAAVAHAADNRQITALITKMMLEKVGESEPLWTIAELLPREFIAAVYLKLLISRHGIAPELT